jgi:hypothetical protein
VWLKLFGSVSPSFETVTPTYSGVQHASAQPAFTVALADRLGEVMFVTNSSANRTVTIAFNGTDNTTNFQTPLITLHNNLAGLQGGASDQDYHLTAAEYTASGTGVFVRQTGPALVNPTVSGVLQVTGSVQASSALRVGPGTDAASTMYISGSAGQNILEVDDWQGTEVLEIRADGSPVFRRSMQVTGSLGVNGGITIQGPADGTDVLHLVKTTV